MSKKEDIYAPLWDDSGKLRNGCTVKMAVDYFKAVGMVSDASITINGKFYTLRQLEYAPGHPEIMRATIKALVPGYYGTHGFVI